MTNDFDRLNLALHITHISSNGAQTTKKVRMSPDAAIVDSGCSRSMVTRGRLHVLLRALRSSGRRVSVFSTPCSYVYTVANGEIEHSAKAVRFCSDQFGEVRFQVIERFSSSVPFLLGMDFLKTKKVDVNFQDGVLTYDHGGQRIQRKFEGSQRIPMFFFCLAWVRRKKSMRAMTATYSSERLTMNSHVLVCVMAMRTSTDDTCVRRLL